jgi:hypothetical protein
MKTGKIAVLAILFLACSGYLSAGTPSADTPEGVIRGLYGEYQPADFKQLNVKQKLGLGIKYDNKAILSRYFDANLTGLFFKDEKCKEASGGICNLDFDPVLDAQDYDADTPFNLKIKQVSGKPLRFSVIFTNIGTRSLVYEFVRTASGPRISDIIYSNNRSLKKILSQKTD